jgi:hypothetical protein
MVAMLTAFLGAALAAPYRSPPASLRAPEPSGDQQSHTLVVKLAENQGLSFIAGKLSGPEDALHRKLEGAEPLFSRSRASLLSDRASASPMAKLADLSLYLRVDTTTPTQLFEDLHGDPRIEHVYLAPDPVPPPFDVPPETPSFLEDQHHLGPGPQGFGFDIQQRWPQAEGLGIMVADLEYGFDPEHEMLNEIDVLELGHASGLYLAHGNGVLGILAPRYAGYGVSGMVPDASFAIVYPFSEPDIYNVADAINRAAAVLLPGDVLLIEQQGWVDGTFTPVEIDPAVFDAIATAVAQGIVVIEPAGNGACDLDDPRWEGWFDRNERDSGAIMVGGGASPYSDLPERSWFTAGSCYGDRVDVQGWFDAIVTASAADGAPGFVDLFYPDSDTRQAYTARFGGTSGAAPMVAATAAALNGFWTQRTGEPLGPMDLRAAMVSTGHPQQFNAETHHIGPQPDLRRLLRIYGVR